MPKFFALVSFLLGWLVVASGCWTSPAPKPTRAVADSTPRPGSAPVERGATLHRIHKGAAVSDEEALAVGQRIEVAVATGDADAFEAEFDWRAFRNLAIADVPRDTELEASFRRGMGQGLDKVASKISSELFGQLSPGTYVLLGVRERTDGKRLLFRLQSADGSFTYHELCLARRAGRARVVDIYLYSSGEMMSKSIERTALATIPSEGLERVSRVPGADKEALKHAATMQRLAEAVKSGEGAKGLAEYAKLPKKLRETKFAQLFRVTCAATVDDAHYLEAIEEYQRLFPGDPSLDLIAMHAFTLRKDWQGAHDAIDRLDAAVGGDPYLQVMHGHVYVSEGDYERAVERAETVLAHNPDDYDAHWLLVSVSMARKDHAETARLLTEIRDKFAVELGEVLQMPEYADFVASAEYEKWQQSP